MGPWVGDRDETRGLTTFNSVPSRNGWLIQRLKPFDCRRPERYYSLLVGRSLFKDSGQTPHTSQQAVKERIEVLMKIPFGTA